MKTFIREVNYLMYPNKDNFSKTETFLALLGLFVITAMAWLPMALLVFTW